jgi:hypothetical protein
MSIPPFGSRREMPPHPLIVCACGVVLTWCTLMECVFAEFPPHVVPVCPTCRPQEAS